MNKYQEIINGKEEKYIKIFHIVDEIIKKFNEGKSLTESETVLLCTREFEDNINQDGIDGYIKYVCKKIFPQIFCIYS